MAVVEGGLNADGNAEEHLQIVLFFQEVDSREWKDAIDTIRSCRSAHSRQHMLRELLARLLLQQEWETICKKIAWEEFSEEVIAQLLLKALNQPPTVTPNVYELITAFYIAQKNYLQASKTMYHWAQQLSRIPQDQTILVKRRDALAASLTYLNLSTREGFSFSNNLDEVITSQSSNSQTADDGSMDVDSQTKQSRWIIHTAEKQKSTTLCFIRKLQLEREWALVDGRLLICNEKQTIPSSDPQDVLDFLLETHRFSQGFSFASLFDFPLVKVLHGLVMETIKCSYNRDRCPGENQMFVSTKFSSDPWDVVKSLMETITKHRPALISNALHTITHEILRHGLKIPHWLDSLYMEHDIGVYLQLLSDFGLNEAALKTLIAHLEPIIGKVLGTDARVFLPYWAIDVVLVRAKEDKSQHVKELFTMAVKSLQSLQNRIQSFEVANKQSQFAGSHF